MPVCVEVVVGEDVVVGVGVSVSVGVGVKRMHPGFPEASFVPSIPRSPVLVMINSSKSPCQLAASGIEGSSV